jgi:3-methyl-2-oxobutanoate hydroxymethyltransferase
MTNSQRGSSPRAASPSKITVPHVQAAKGDHPLVMLTAYDAPSGRIADTAGVDMILVGDSLGMVVLGYEDTLRVDLEDMIRHTAAVSRVHPRALLVADMPYLSYHTGPRDTVLAAGRLIREGRAEAVKLEGGRKRVPAVQALVDAEIPVVGHLGLTPQSLHRLGGYRVQGRLAHQIDELFADAKALEAEGIFSLVLEGIPHEVATELTQELTIPTIGIGAGSGCDGQVLVFHDLLGLGDGPPPKFVREYESLGARAVEAVQRFAEDVRQRSFPSRQESYRLPRETGEALSRRRSTKI